MDSWAPFNKIHSPTINTSAAGPEAGFQLIIEELTLSQEGLQVWYCHAFKR